MIDDTKSIHLSCMNRRDARDGDGDDSSWWSHGSGYAYYHCHYYVLCMDGVQVRTYSSSDSSDLPAVGSDLVFDFKMDLDACFEVVAS